MVNWTDYAEDISELTYRLKISVVALFCSTLFFLAAPASLNQNFLTFYKPIVSILLDLIRSFLLPSNVQLLPGSPSAPITIYTIASLFFGFLLASPVIFYEVWAFIRPALEYEGVKIPNRLIFVSLGFFLIGCAFGFFVMMPAVLLGLFAFFPYVGVNAYLINAQEFYSMIFWTTIVSGLSFLAPIVIYLSAKYLNMDVRAIAKHRKYLWAIVYVGSAFITPDSNILADFVLFIPLILMIEGSLFIASRIKK